MTDGYTERPLAASDIEQCLQLWVDRMADGYQDRVLLVDAATAVEGHVGRVAEAADEVVAFAAGRIGTFAGVLSVPYEVVADCTVEPLERVGVLSVVCVAEEHERRGLGTTLAELVTAELATEVPVLVSEVWHRGGVDGGDVLESLGFECAHTGEGYWQHSTAGTDPCPRCESTPCQCSGSLYVRRCGG